MVARNDADLDLAALGVAPAVIVQITERMVVSGDLSVVVIDEEGRIAGGVGRDVAWMPTGADAAAIFPFLVGLDETLLDLARSDETFVLDTVSMPAHPTLKDRTFTVELFPDPFGGTVMTFRDEGDRAVIQQRIMQQRNELMLTRQLLEKRTAALEAANGSLEEFVQAITHDIRAPLRGMESVVEMLRNLPAVGTSDDARTLAETLHVTIGTLIDLTEGLLAVARADRGAVEVDDVLMDQLIADIVDSLQLQSVEIVFRPGWPTVSQPPVLLHQVLQNLIGNAAKFNDKPDKKIELRWSALDEDHIRIEVEDNGIGIRPAHIDRIFDLFRRAHSDKFTGSGVGLALVKRATERMGGTVSVRSEPGQGTIFQVDLPRVFAARDQEPLDGERLDRQEDADPAR